MSSPRFPRRRYQNKGRVCRFADCSHPAKGLGLCVGHYDQVSRGLELRPLHDRERLTESQRSYWTSMPPEEREERLRGLRSTPPYERTEEWSRQASESRRTAWASGAVPKFKRKTCRGCGAQYQPNSGRQVYCTNECYRLCRRAVSYGVAPEELLALMERQDGVCALCRRPECGFFRGAPLVVDHCHDTGKVRGLLCGDCNTAIGRFGDDPARLRAAADYLEGALLH